MPRLRLEIIDLSDDETRGGSQTTSLELETVDWTAVFDSN